MARVAMVTQRANLNKGPGWLSEAGGGVSVEMQPPLSFYSDQFTLIVSYLIHFLRIHRFNENV